MKRMLATVSLVLGALVPAASEAAVSFPIEYTGSYRLTVTLTNPYGSGLCTDTGALTMTLQSDGTAIWRAAEITAFTLTPAGQPPSCDVRPSGETVTWTGTHDKVSRFTLPSGSATLPPVTGHFDEEHIRAEYRIGDHTFIEWNLPAVSHLFAIDPDPSQGFDFHIGILEGRGFKLVLRDPHGRDHLDFSTLKITVGGVDTTQHILRQLSQGIVPFTEQSPDSLTKVFWVRPDPKKLMPDPGNPTHSHDLFAIPFNGDWPIVLRICDKAGTCFGKSYNVYFGPFATAPRLVRPADGRCVNAADAVLRLGHVTIGNVGIDAPRTALYVGLTNAVQGMWTFAPRATGEFVFAAWWQGIIEPYIPSVPMASGFIAKYSEVSLPVSIAKPAGISPGYSVPFPAGEFTFVMAAVDGDTGAYRRDERIATTCQP